MEPDGRKLTLFEQAEAKLGRERHIAYHLAAWERELNQTDYYDWFLEQVLEKEKEAS